MQTHIAMIGSHLNDASVRPKGASREEHHVLGNILKGMPIEVFDDEQKQIWENDTYELVTSRP